QPGWKYSEWDLRGVPVRIEIGPRDVDAETAVLARRDRHKQEPGQRRSVAQAQVPEVLRELLDEIQDSLYDQAKSFLDEHTFATVDRSEFFDLCKSRAGMIDIVWCERAECEAHVKALTTATTRLVRDLEERNLTCVACGEPAKARAYFAQSY
ncbi:MAG TPA: His/Gly/Thr/Pro-type tRNA ligase C-terminal domain-containing protein, partial [Candidatus Cybelea sp.]